jgi:Spx/MgsR family transcriptional regulator
VLTIYGIPSCDTCRNARKWLTEHDREHRFHDLRQDGLDMEMLERWTGTLDWEKLLNTRSLTWRKVPEVDRAGMTVNRAMALMLDQPTLVKRPVLEWDDHVEVGFSPAGYEKIFT